MNYFGFKNTAERYTKGRPYFHANTIQRLKEFLQLNGKLPNALDIACGTGLSTQALLAVAGDVYGTDASAEMLKQAVKNDAIHYSVASAEQQPFDDHTFDLITVCSGVHWFEIDAFLAESNRLLKDKGWLVLYDNFFISEMENVPEFSNWFPDVYLNRFPSPPRNADYSWTNENLLPKNFNFIKEEAFKNAITFTKEELVLYFTTQSNISNAVENGKSTYQEIEHWLDEQLQSFFKDENKRTVLFGNWIKYMQRQ